MATNMEKESDLEMTWLENSNTYHKLLLIMGAGLLGRILLNTFFHIKYGWHAVNHLEIWLYTGVANGTHTKYLAGRGLDPTTWILGLVGKILPPELTLYGVEAAAIFLATLTGFLLYLFVREKYSETTAFFSGMLYVFMIEPLALSVVSFTHSHIQLPLILLLLLLTAKIVKPCSWSKRVAYLLCFLFLAYFGFKINQEIIVGLAASAIYFTGEILSKRHSYIYLTLVCVGIILGGYYLLPNILGEMLADLPQGSGGSHDVIPVSQSNLWIRYNLLIFLLPLGLFVCFKRRDTISPALLLMGLMIALQMDRGTRIMNLGFAVLTAHAITGWKLDRVPEVLVVLCLVGYSVNLAFIDNMDVNRIGSQLEYSVLKSLPREGGGSILVGWDKGYMAEVVSGHKSVSTPARIREDTHNLLWLPEREAAKKLASRNVGYVLVSSKNINVVYEGGGRLYYVIAGGLLFNSGRPLPVELVVFTSAYRLRHNLVGGDYFRLVGGGVDRHSSVEVYLYEVVEE